ncbi:hypothetical protein, partial [Pseudomonas syringae]|uniref:hypothetical protein n=1 Tax=Pseudomonas syringae TaxID=317 RepID=UPI001C823B9C
NPPGSTTSSSKDVHGRLFLCLKSRKIKDLSAIWLCRGFLSASRLGIPNGIPSLPVLFFGIPKRCQR